MITKLKILKPIKKDLPKTKLTEIIENKFISWLVKLHIFYPNHKKEATSIFCDY